MAPPRDSDDGRPNPDARERLPAAAEIESLFRRESGRLISVLTRIFGPRNLGLAEDVVQESFLTAVRTWSADGIPDNPAAWLLTTARNRAIDAIRRERTRRTFSSDLAVYLEGEWTLMTVVNQAFQGPVKDDQLRMIFMCCHPSLTPENSLTLILKTLCGLSIPATARALLASEATVNKRLLRARRKLRGAEFALPTGADLRRALETVHAALYLLFNEGHLSISDKPILKDLIRDAMSMTQLLAEEPSLATSDTHALLALMSFHAARLDSRLDAAGRLVPLDKQDRALWDGALIRKGFAHLVAASGMEAVYASRYHLEAAIAARHCQAAAFEETDWASVCNLYDRLVEAAPSPMAELNRAVAISYRDGPAAAIPLVERLRASGEALPEHVVSAVLASFHSRAGSDEPARRFLEEALASAPTEHERLLIAAQFEVAR
jgi:RNA polymerase sigma factor (sigma-70 family)